MDDIAQITLVNACSQQRCSFLIAASKVSRKTLYCRPSTVKASGVHQSAGC